ncbi:MAG: Na/Pi cotransporter family protein [Sandaracinus sp.]|nr:Na/Pi cotransporter family protein [Sandaracinus sp.]
MSVGATLALVASFAGGLGFFLLGMHELTEGLKLAAGGALRRILQGSTSTRFRALFAGAGMTALVQSSSAVTVATLGFVNAGLLELPAAVWVVFGSNVGTTTTGWLVSLSGFDVDLEAAALPIVGIGTLLQLTGPTKRRGSIGRAISGLGLFFVGVGFLQTSFADLAQSVDLAALRVEGIGGRALLFVIGVGLTTVMQSSSAAIAVTLTAAAAGALDLAGACTVVVIGANVGTTTTALFGAMGATPDARRTALAHTAFNVVAGVVAFVSLPLLVAVDALDDYAPGEGLAARVALFHTGFNVLGVVAMWPFAGRLVQWLQARFVPTDEVEGAPAHLDRTVLSIPHVALAALGREGWRLFEIARRVLAAALASDVSARTSRLESFERLLRAITEAIDRVEGRGLPAEVASGVRTLLRATRHLVIVCERSDELTTIPEGPFHEALSALLAEAGGGLDVDRLGELYGVLDERFDRRLDELAEEATSERPVREVMDEQHVIGEARRAAKHLVRAARELSALQPPPTDDQRVAIAR